MSQRKARLERGWLVVSAQSLRAFERADLSTILNLAKTAAYSTDKGLPIAMAIVEGHRQAFGAGRLALKVRSQQEMSLRVVVRSSELAGVILGPERHRRWSDAQKIKIVGDTLVPGVRVSEVMARYNVSSSLVYTWCKQARLGLFGPLKQAAFAPVAIVDATKTALSDNPICLAVGEDFNSEPMPHDQTAGEPVDLAPNSDGAAMVVALPDRVRILVNNNVDEGALGKVLRALALVKGR